MVKIKAALFDLDGVVVDTEDSYTEFWNAQGEKYHPEIPNFALGIKGSTLAQVFDKFFSGNLEKYRTQVELELDKFEASMPYKFIDGIVDFLKLLKSSDIRTAVVTSSTKKKMESVYKVRPELLEFFDRIFTSDDVTKSKPDPQCYNLAAKYFEADPRSGFVFEDSFSGLKAARASGMSVIGLATTNPAEKISPLCDVVIPNFIGVGLEIFEIAQKNRFL